jgi:transposase-like protein
MRTRKNLPRKKRKKQGRRVPPFPIEFKVKVARLREEDGYPAKLIAQQFGISEYSVYRWGKRYRHYGAADRRYRRLLPSLSWI